MSEAVVDPLILSFQVALVATFVTLPPAIAVARLLTKRKKGGLLLDTIVMSPLVIPPLVTGYLLLLLFGKNGPVGSFLETVFGVKIAFTWIGAAIAAGVVAFPIMVRAIQLGFESVDPDLEKTARTLGAGPWDGLFSVTLPLAFPAILSGAILGFARSLGEFGATIVLAGNIPGKTRTIPLAIYTEINKPGGEDKATLLLLISLGLSIGALIIAHLINACVMNVRRRRDSKHA